MKNLKTLLALISVLSTSALADVTINQPDKILQFTGYDGRNIQIELEFKKPLDAGDGVDLMIGGKTILVVKNETANKLERFVSRLRFNKDEVLTIKTSGKSQSTTTFTPTVASDFVLPSKDSFDTKPMASVVTEEIAKAYNVKLGDCAYLFRGISNSGSSVPKSFVMQVDGGTISVQSSERLAASPFFIVGLSETAKKCEVSVQ